MDAPGVVVLQLSVAAMLPLPPLHNGDCPGSSPPPRNALPGLRQLRLAVWRIDIGAQCPCRAAEVGAAGRIRSRHVLPRRAS